MKRIKSEEINRISTTNTDGLLRVFYRLVDDLKFELDNKFKNYNRLIKDSKKKIDQTFQFFYNILNFLFWTPQFRGPIFLALVIFTF